MIMQRDSDTRHFEALKRILNACRGRARAMTLATLAAQLALPRRTVEQLIEENLERFPFPIVSGATGIYQPATAEDIERYAHSLHTRHKAMQRRERILLRKARAAGYHTDADGHFVDPERLTQQELLP